MWISSAIPPPSSSFYASSSSCATQPPLKNNIIAKLPLATYFCLWSDYGERRGSRDHVCRATHKPASFISQWSRLKVPATSRKSSALACFHEAAQSVHCFSRHCKVGAQVQANSSHVRRPFQNQCTISGDRSSVLRSRFVVHLGKANPRRTSADADRLSGQSNWMAEDQNHLGNSNTLRELAESSEVVQGELEAYVTAIKRAMSMPYGSKPIETDWQLSAYFSRQTKALKKLAYSSCFDGSEEHQIACEVLDALGMSKSPAVALNVLIEMGVFPFHVNLDLLKSGRQLEFPETVQAAAHALRFKTFSLEDMKKRVDLTSLKVYCIDPEDTDEIDDGISATVLEDDRVKLWVHVADPTSWISPGSPLEKEARRRGTSIYLPTQTLSMFPMDLVNDCLSFRQAAECFALSISIILKEDGSIAESMIMSSIIRPTYQLSYHQASELIYMNLEEENELSLLSRAATLRRQWRKSQGASDLSSYPPKVKVTNADSVDPLISIQVPDPANPAVELVAELMILCGEAVSMFGYQNSLVLPYRGQLLGDLRAESVFPEPYHPGKGFSVPQDLGPVDVNIRRPSAHSFLGLPGYVQFTSPIRRYNDILAHYQVKAALHGYKPLLSHSYMAAGVVWANKTMREAKALELLANRYWILEHLRRQPRDKVYRSDILYFKKDREAVVFLQEVGVEAAITIHSKAGVGNEIKVMVKEAQPRKSVLILMEAP